MKETPTHVELMCFVCDRSEVRRLDSLPFFYLRDYQCPACRRTGTTHVIRVQTTKSAIKDQLSRSHERDRAPLPRDRRQVG